MTIPMWVNLDNVFICPPTLIIIVSVFWKTTNIHYSKMRIDVRPGKRCRFSAIIKSCPNKTSHKPRSVHCKFPPFFGGLSPTWFVQIIIRQITFYGIFYIHSSGANHTRYFTKNNGLFRMFFMIIV
ncbi:hypothetical protein D3C84_885060 [compost metagenome]